MDKTITCCAVIVTYNRKLLLEQCLNALSEQTVSLTKIIIIDNASTDGTQQYIEEYVLPDSRISYLRQAENTGGAGGFHMGVKSALASGCEYFWLMDDDGLPANDCLAQLINNTGTADYLGPLVIDPINPQKLSFPLRRPGTAGILVTEKDMQAVAEDNVVYNILAPFNGVLLSRKVVQTVGLPDKKYFIWGDEIDYTQRILKCEFKLATILSARFYHPRVETVGKKMFFNLMQFNDTDSEMKLFCLCRNNVFIKKTYFGFHYAVLFTLKVLWFYLFTQPSIRKIGIAISAMYSGWRNRFSNNFR